MIPGPGTHTDLVIIHPGRPAGVYGPLADDLIAIEPPMWARLIAGYVRDRGHNTRIIDAEATRMSPVEVADRVIKIRPRLVCIAAYGHQPSASTQQMAAAGATARAIKERTPAYIPVVIVGGHVSALPERTMLEELVDYACIGEGPETVAGLLDGDAHDSIPGLVWRDRSRIVANPAAALIEDLRDLHGDAWDLLPMASYRAHNWQCFGDLGSRQPYASIYTSLGCPYRCSFCCINAPFASNRYRMRHPAHVVAEIAHLHARYGVRTFKIIDEMFVLNERHYTAIAEGMIASGLPTGDLNIWAYARVDTVKPAHLSLLRKAGFRWLALGIESGSAHVRDGASKKLRNDDIVGVVRAIQAAGINVIGNYIFGLPDDDMDTMRATLALARECNTEFANFYSGMAYPGSPLYAQALREGWALPMSWLGYSQHSYECRPLDTKHVSGAEVLRFRDHAFRSYFGGGNYTGMVLGKFGPETLAHVQDMLKYRLPRRLLAEAVPA